MSPNTFSSNGAPVVRRITLQHIATLALTAALVTSAGQGTAAASDPQWESPRPSPTQQ